MKSLLSIMLAGLALVSSVSHADAIDELAQTSESYYHELYLRGLNEHDKKIWKSLDLVSIEAPVQHKTNTNYMGTVRPSASLDTVHSDSNYMGTVRQ